MAGKRAILAGFRGHSPRWFEFHDKQIEIVAVSGLNDRSKQRMQQHGCEAKLYDDPAEMINNEDAEIALIWTPRTEDHVPLGLKAVERGMAVMIEKPLSEDAAEAMAFVAAADKAGVTNMVMQNIRWQSAAMEVREALDEGRIGQLYWLEVALRGLHRAFIYEGIHLVDLARYWYGQEAEWVMAAGASPSHQPLEHDNVISLTVGFAGGGVAKVTMDWSSLGHHHWIKARLQGDKAAMRVTWGEPIEVQAPGEPVEQIPKWTRECNDMKRLLAHFIECMDSGATPINNCADHLKTLDMIYGAWESAKQRRVVKLPFKIK